MATERLALTPSGQVRYQLKTPYRDGTTHIVLEPLDLMARLAALVPPPRMHLTRYHGVFAPHSKLRAAITPAGRGAGGKGAKQGAEAPAVPKHVAMRWAQRLKRLRLASPPFRPAVRCWPRGLCRRSLQPLLQQPSRQGPLPCLASTQRIEQREQFVQPRVCSRRRR